MYTAPVVAVERNGRPIFVLEQLVETLVGVYILTAAVQLCSSRQERLE